MKKRIIARFLLLVILLCLCSCSDSDPNSTFSIHFIDVGQGDAALVECDGHYMLIDGGDTSAGEKVYNALKDKKAKQLDYLIISHLHEDHYGGLSQALTYLQGSKTIGKVLCNKTSANTNSFREFERELGRHNSSITVPQSGEIYTLGSAEILIVDSCADEDNDSLVLLITYGDTKFLFTGDIEDGAQKRICEKYPRTSLEDIPMKVDLMKLPHHGSFANTLQTFLETFMPDYVVISVGKGNSYGHPHERTLDKLKKKTWSPEVYRTDLNGDIIVKSDGKSITVLSS